MMSHIDASLLIFYVIKNKRKGIFYFFSPELISNNNNKQKQPVKHYCLVFFWDNINKMYQNNWYVLIKKMLDVR